MNLIDISDLQASDISEIWKQADKPVGSFCGTVGCSFEGNGVRTRTSFIQAFRELGLAYIELPNLLKTDERLVDLAGYLDEFYQLYVIRESNHDQLRAFARYSGRPVINAMSNGGHPCEVLTDALSLQKRLGPLTGQRICLWGPPSNIFRSWHQMAQVLKFQIWHACESQHHNPDEIYVTYTDQPSGPMDVVITDSWSSSLPSQPGPEWSLSAKLLHELGTPVLLPTPPFFIGKELAFDPTTYPNFTGYAQKAMLLKVQRAILTHMIEH